MPIGKTEFQTGKQHSQVEDEITLFLNERKDMAFTSQEIMAGAHFQTDFSTLETSRISTFSVADFIALLYEMVRKGKLRTRVVEGHMYFAAGTGIAKCPKCGAEVAEPKKTWKMTGRPDKHGRRLTLNIGLFECPTHGAFKIALSKQKV